MFHMIANSAWMVNININININKSINININKIDINNDI